MRDVHLRPPDDDALPSRRLGWGVGGFMVLLWAVVLGAAWQQRTEEVAERVAAGRLDPATLIDAPPARYPGGVDKRALDAHREPAAGSAAGVPGRGAPPAQKGGKGPVFSLEARPERR